MRPLNVAAALLLFPAVAAPVSTIRRDRGSDSSAKQPAVQDQAHNESTVEGCLRDGPEFTSKLTMQSGRTILVSGSPNLRELYGHTVKLTGRMRGEGKNMSFVVYKIEDLSTECNY